MSPLSVLLIIAAFIPAYIAAVRHTGTLAIGATLLLCLTTVVFPLTWLIALLVASLWPRPIPSSR